jgi:hypothetical protein
MAQEIGKGHFSHLLALGAANSDTISGDENKTREKVN